MHNPRSVVSLALIRAMVGWSHIGVLSSLVIDEMGHMEKEGFRPVRPDKAAGNQAPECGVFRPPRIFDEQDWAACSPKRTFIGEHGI